MFIRILVLISCFYVTINTNTDYDCISNRYCANELHQVFVSVF